MPSEAPRIDLEPNERSDQVGGAIVASMNRYLVVLVAERCGPVNHNGRQYIRSVRAFSSLIEGIVC